MGWLPNANWVPYELLLGCILIGACALLLFAMMLSLQDLVYGLAPRIAGSSDELKAQVVELNEQASAIREVVQEIRIDTRTDRSPAHAPGTGTEGQQRQLP